MYKSSESHRRSRIRERKEHHSDFVKEGTSMTVFDDWWHFAFSWLSVAWAMTTEVERNRKEGGVLCTGERF